jgi:AAA15 family ATPase/GTPase
MRIKIENFKSIENIEFETAKINVLIGKANSGKSNILEALQLYGTLSTVSAVLSVRGVKIELYNISSLLEQMLSAIRQERKYRDFFPFGDTSRKINIEVDKEWAKIEFEKESLVINSSSHIPIEENASLLDLREKYKSFATNFTLYSDRVFNPDRYDIWYSDPIPPFLLPSGENLSFVLGRYAQIVKLLNEKLESLFNLNFTYNFSTRKVSISGGGIDMWPKLVSDGAKRFIYFFTAVHSQKWFGIEYKTTPFVMLEEPEVRLHPEVISELVKSIIETKECNFIISTHNPYLLSYFVDADIKKDELKIFGVYKKKEFTKIKEIELEKAAEKLMGSYDMIENVYELIEE